MKLDAAPAPAAAAGGFKPAARDERVRGTPPRRAEPAGAMAAAFGRLKR